MQLENTDGLPIQASLRLLNSYHQTFGLRHKTAL